MSPFIFIFPIFFIGFLFFGYLASKAAFYDLDLLRRAKLWPSVKGELLSVDIDKKLNKSSDSRRLYVYGIKVKYEYSVAGKKYISNRLNFAKVMSSNLKKVNKRAEALIDLEGVDVYFDPNNPKECVLNPKITAGTVLIIVAGVLFSLVGLVSACFYIWFNFTRDR